MTAPSYTDWHVGMKVVCVDGASRPGYKYIIEELPQAGRIYTIREIGPVPSFHSDRGKLAVKLAEIHRVEDRLGWRVERFRPVKTRQTDISIFTAMLSPKPAKAKKVRA